MPNVFVKLERDGAGDHNGRFHATRATALTTEFRSPFSADSKSPHVKKLIETAEQYGATLTGPKKSTTDVVVFAVPSRNSAAFAEAVVAVPKIQSAALQAKTFG